MNIGKTKTISPNDVPAEWAGIIDKVETIKDMILELSDEYKVDIDFSTSRKYHFFSVEVGNGEERRISGFHDYSKLTRNIWEDGSISIRAYKFIEEGSGIE